MMMSKYYGEPQEFIDDLLRHLRFDIFLH